MVDSFIGMTGRLAKLLALKNWLCQTEHACDWIFSTIDSGITLQ